MKIFLQYYLFFYYFGVRVHIYHNTYIGGVSGDICLIINDIGSESGSGLDFINGQTWLQRFYAVFDSGNSRVEFATTSYTDATTN